MNQRSQNPAGFALERPAYHVRDLIRDIEGVLMERYWTERGKAISKGKARAKARREAEARARNQDAQTRQTADG